MHKLRHPRQCRSSSAVPVFLGSAGLLTYGSIDLSSAEILVCLPEAALNIQADAAVVVKAGQRSHGIGILGICGKHLCNRDSLLIVDNSLVITSLIRLAQGERGEREAVWIVTGSVSSIPSAWTVMPKVSDRAEPATRLTNNRF